MLLSQSIEMPGGDPCKKDLIEDWEGLPVNSKLDGTGVQVSFKTNPEFRIRHDIHPTALTPAVIISEQLHANVIDLFNMAGQLLHDPDISGEIPDVLRCEPRDIFGQRDMASEWIIFLHSKFKPPRIPLDTYVKGKVFDSQSFEPFSLDKPKENCVSELDDILGKSIVLLDQFIEETSGDSDNNSKVVYHPPGTPVPENYHSTPLEGNKIEITYACDEQLEKGKIHTRRFDQLIVIKRIFVIQLSDRRFEAHLHQSRPLDSAMVRLDSIRKSKEILPRNRCFV